MEIWGRCKNNRLKLVLKNCTMVNGMKAQRIDSLNNRTAMLLVGFMLVFLGIGVEPVWAEDCIADDWDPLLLYSRGDTVTLRQQ
jgi:hypothetical protein